MIATEWRDFKVPDSERVKRHLHDAVLFDGRNLFEPAARAAAGLTCYSVERGGVRPGTSHTPDSEQTYSLTSMNSRAQTM